MAKANLPAQASRSGCSYDGGRVRVPFFNRTFWVHSEDPRVEEESGSPPPWDVQLVILHYLLNADGTPPSGMWVTYRHIPDAFLFEARFNSMAVEPLARAFGADLAGFRRAAEALGGIEMTRTGDAAYRFIALPQIPMGCILYLADDELAASASILFDASAAQYLCAEDLAYLGIYLSESLLKEVGKGRAGV
jgi:hypothetical protein